MAWEVSSGSVTVDGNNLSDLEDAELTRFRLEKIGFIFQFYNLISTLNAAENVVLPMTFANVQPEEREKESEKNF